MATKLAAALAGCALIAGCATTGTNGAVNIGPDLYMIGGHGGLTDYSGSVVKARFFQQAAKFCEQQGRTMVPVNSTGQDSTPAGAYASAEVQFRCVAKPKVS